jgi:cullin 1
MNTIELEEGWAQIETHIEKLIHCVWPSPSGHTDRVINNRDYMSVFTLVYQMCIQKAPHNYSEQLHSRYNKKSKDVFVDHVVPKIDVASYTESVIQEQWMKYKTFMKWMRNFFSYMDRFHTKRQILTPIKGYDMGKKIFRDHLCDRLSEERIDAILN